MKKFRSLVVLMMAMALVASFTIPAFAQEKLLETKIEKMTVKKDKNGEDFVLIIVKEQKTLNGITYPKETTAIIFASQSDLVAQAQANYSPGDDIKAIVAVNEYQGRTNYNILHFLN